MPERENKDLVLRYLEEFNEDNLEAAAACFADDLVGHEPGRNLHGRDGIRHSLAGFRNTFPDIQVTVEDLVAEEDRVVARWRFRGTQRGEVLGVAPTGKRVTVTGMIFYGISEDGISEYWGSWDRMGLLQQLDAPATLSVSPRLRLPRSPESAHLVFQSSLRRRVEGQPEAVEDRGPQVAKQVHLCLQRRVQRFGTER